MAAANRDLYLEQFTTFSKRLDFAVDGVPTDLTDHAFKAELRFETDGPLVGGFSFSKTDQATDRGGVYMMMTLSEWQTIKLPKSPASERKLFSFIYDVIQTFPDGTTERILEGTAKISPGVTRP